MLGGTFLILRMLKTVVLLIIFVETVINFFLGLFTIYMHFDVSLLRKIINFFKKNNKYRLQTLKW